VIGDGDGDAGAMDGAGGIDAVRVASVQAVIVTTSNRGAFFRIAIAMDKDTLAFPSIPRQARSFRLGAPAVR